MAEEIDFENGHTWRNSVISPSSGLRDSHVLRDTRDLMVDNDSPSVDLSVETISLALRLLVVEKSSFELCQNRLKTALPANFKVEYFENETEIQKSGPIKFRYCLIDWQSITKSDLGP